MITFKNSDLAAIANFLGELNLKNKASRGRTRLIEILAKRQEQLGADELALAECYVPKGKEVVNEDRTLNILPDKQAEFTKEREDLFNEQVNIDMSEYQSLIDAFFNAMNDIDVEFKGQDAVIYDVVMTQLENNMKEGK